MTGEAQAHETSTSMVKPALAEVDAGTDIALKVRASCPAKCNIQGSKVRIVDNDDAAVKDINLLSFDGTTNETDEFVVKAPNKPEAHT